ncbi:hypothetical protein Pedsa_0073 [Pseudopedobacter saltans DSM 12145]|uniref:DUF5689 domain-containing protein n=1 Tax=Pseudopedobacter saltans (strain ATCC 51119 / DSM 12145 / JCM 21818 / CCUG 39354 / LMG 10337 / NBRC 100064 / NCIMB 13643) TaxID=762903 RepID=F0SCS2_PSESL|nr:DUF5689 domain-containing protein [Pseudopedobacter saltans]ADY50661.1 hypothetical protein Pedsa_0073 [Pseudopedobacter saltans DSM 12145]
MKIYLKNFFVYLAGLIVLASCSKNEYESGGTVSTVMSITKIKSLHNGDDVLINKENFEGAYQVSGVVISDRNNGNIAPNEIVVQNSSRGTTSGLIFSFNDNNVDVNLGDSIKIDIHGTVLARKNGALKVSGENFTFSKITKVSSNNIVKPRLVTLIDLYSNFFGYESTLVQLNSMSFDNVANGQVYNGEAKFHTESASAIYLTTLPTASFAQKALPLLADFVGIATYYDANSNNFNRAKTLLRMRNEEDTFNETGAIYANFPETFESVPASQKADYLMPAIDDKVTFGSGTWRLYQAVIGNTPSYDRFNPLNGLQAIRLKDKLNGSAYLEMNFDLTHGASKIEIIHAIYGLYSSDPKVASAWNLEYSQDQGATWTKLGNTVAETNTKNPSIVTFNVNIKGKVRFRINKLGYDGYPNGQTGMLNIDDFTVYQNID